MAADPGRIEAQLQLMVSEMVSMAVELRFVEENSE